MDDCYEDYMRMEYLYVWILFIYILDGWDIYCESYKYIRMSKMGLTGIGNN
jgi:hypothetical protein